MESKQQKLREEEEEKEGHIHVLAVDDSVIERKMLEKLLTDSSYHVTCLDSGDKALEYLGLVHHRPDNIDDHVYDDDDDSTIDQSQPSADHQEQGQGRRVNLIMTDYSMPGTSGYDLLKKVKGSCWKDVPVVVMSSENVPSRIDMCLEGGAEDFLLKPVRLSDLKKLLPHIFNKSTSTSHCYRKNRSYSKQNLLGGNCNLVASEDNSNNN